MSRRFRTQLVAGLLAAMLGTNVAAAPDTSLLVSQYQHTAWLARDGAPIGIHAVAQTDDGYLWVGSEEGLFRFDGQTFERVPTPGGTVAGQSYVYALVAQPGGALWVGFRRGDGIGLVRNGQFTRIPATLKHNVDFMAQDSHGTLWAQLDQGIYRIEGAQVEPIAQGWNVPPRPVNLAVDRSDSVWVVNGDGRLFRRLPGGTRFEQYTDDFPVEAIAVDLQGGLWGSNLKGTRTIEKRNGNLAGVRQSIAGNFFGTMLFDREGGLWLQHRRGLSREADPTTALDERVNRDPAATIFTAEQGLSSETIYAIFQDRDGNVWTGTSKGLDRFRRTALTPVRLPVRALSFAMAPAGGNAVWAGNWGGSLMKITEGPLQTYPEVGPGIKFIRNDSRGGTWAGGGAGLWHSSDGKRFDRVPVDDAFIADSLRAVAADGAGGFWLSGGIPGRLAHVVDGRWTDASPSDGFPSRGSPSCMVRDDRQRIWACLGRDPFVIDGGKARMLSSMARGLDIGTVIDIHPHGERLWLGGYTGLALFDGRRIVNLGRSDGLPFGEVGGVVELAGGDVWLHNRTHAIRIPAAEVKAVLAGTRAAVDVESLDETDGLYGTLSASSPLPTLVQGDDGRLWFATDAGLAWLDPTRREKTTPPPPVHIRSLITDGRPHDIAVAPRLAPLDKHVELTYSATALTRPGRVRFRYRLDGIDTDWQDVGARRTAYFNDLPPGAYTFRVKSTDEYGRWNEAESRLEFEVAAAWFQTAWFKSAVVALLGLMAWSLHRWRARHLLRLAEDRHRLLLQTRIAERDRIARELHDTVLQGTIGLVLNLQVAIDRLGLDEPERQRFEALLARAESSVAETRVRVAGLRAGEETEGSLADSLLGIREHLVGGTKIDFEFLSASQAWEFDSHVRDQILLIVREAVANACQHARASKIIVRLTMQQRDRVVQVIDDGVGFVPVDHSSTAPARRHWGLHGMRERAAEIGARFEVRSEPGGGTDITIVLPARRLPALRGAWRLFGRFPRRTRPVTMRP